MSVEASALERSKLEKKDRTELLAIVEAMGARAGSRAKKSDLIDQILVLAGFTGPSGTSDASPARSGDRSAAAGPAEGGETEGTAEAGEPTGAGEPTERRGATGNGFARPPGDATSTRALEPGAATAGAEPQRPIPSEAASGTAPGATAPPSAPPAGRGSGAADDPGASGAPARVDGPQPGEQLPTPAQPVDNGRAQSEPDRQQGSRPDEAETGNRRRRRRGRDRDRQANPQAQGGQPGQGGTAGQAQPDDGFAGEPVEVQGYLDLRDEGYGFLRVKGFLPSKNDVYVSVKQVRQLGLRRGDFLKGASRPASRNEKNPALLRIDSVNDAAPDLARDRRRFEDLTPLFPDEKLRLEMADDPGNMTARIVDLISPIGKGQRGLIVSPPKAGKTTIMKQIARSIEVNNPDVHLIVLLVDERPEEVTDMRRWLLEGEVAASTFDRPSEEHTQVAELTIERAKRMVEGGRDVCIILDGITRLARAYNLAAPATGRIMSGGVDSGALYPPKKFFGAARNIEEGGSLTILATALVETGSKMDEVIFEEFKGTGNMELRLDRRLSERRIYPAIDVDASSTRHEELLFDRPQLQMVWKLRRVLSGLGGEGGSGGAGLELLIDRMRRFTSNDEFLAEIGKAPSGSG